MAVAAQHAPQESAEALVRAAFDQLKLGYHESGGLTYAQRMDALGRLADAMRRWEERIADAISADFGHRSRHETAMAEIYFVVNHIKYLRKHLKGWMAPEKRGIEATFLPGKNRVLRQPLGVVGVISPWNYPVQLALTPAAVALAAGNRVLIKPSEATPRTAEVLAELVAELFSPRVAAVVTGGREVGVEFARLPFDHLLFTGSTDVGRHIMRAAAENLVPVTLELGGKSPTIVHRDFPLDDAMERIVSGKLLNAGQTCIAPDYVLVPRDQVDAFVESFRNTTARLYPTLAANPDYTAIVSDSHHARLERYLADAQAHGATVIPVNPAGEALPGSARKLAPTLVTGVSDDMQLMQEEIFGPILPLVPYDTLDEAIAFVNARPRPLALYYFDRDRDRARKVLEETVSGGACVNDVMLHIAQDDMPFGGVGPSGMGAYHGREGFETFSHRKAVFKQARFNLTSLLAPPYGKKIDTLLGFMIGRKKGP